MARRNFSDFIKKKTSVYLTQLLSDLWEKISVKFSKINGFYDNDKDGESGHIEIDIEDNLKKMGHRKRNKHLHIVFYFGATVCIHL